MGARYLSSAAAAEYLGFGTGEKAAGHIRQMVHRRQIPYSKLGAKRLRFDVKELDAWMARNRVAVQETA